MVGRARSIAASTNKRLPPRTPLSRERVLDAALHIVDTEGVEALSYLERLDWGSGYEDNGLVFAKENGTTLRPEWVLKRFHELSAAADLPQVRLHDLRHLAATLMLAAGVPIAMVSKTMRHTQLSTTSDLYGHLTPEAAHAAADSLGGVLDAAAAELANERSLRRATTLRPHRPI